jgi:hypothetical protein
MSIADAMNPTAKTSKGSKNLTPLATNLRGTTVLERMSGLRVDDSEIEREYGAQYIKSSLTSLQQSLSKASHLWHRCRMGWTEYFSSKVLLRVV